MSLILSILFSFFSRMFWKRKAVEESSMHVEEKPMSNNNAPQIKYDVFISFRGEIRNGFLSHLIEAFKRSQINAFVDDKLERGKEVGPSLVGAIEESSISLIIFSEDYASSPWCLKEVVRILKCRDENGQIVIPVFYKVEPTHVGHQSSQSYKKAFDEYQRKNETNVQIWRDALQKAAKISGIVSSNWDDAKLVKEIVRLVQKKLVKPAVNSKRLVGIRKKIANLESLIKQEPKVTRVIGIWGMGGLGKTTLAEQVFNKLRHEYAGSYFLLNERDQSSKRDFISLKKEIFSQLLGRDVNIDLPNSLPTDVLQGIGCIKVLIVLDDVNDSRHIKELLGNLEDFGLGSRIIITTRNQQVLKNEADATYKLQGLNLVKALELFNMKAFKKLDDQREYNMLSQRVVRYAQGIPLVLEVLAGHLRGNTREVWEGELDKLENMPHKEVYDVMKRSYDDLDREQQQIFLDIACFFLIAHHVISVGDLKFLLKDDESGNSVVSNLERLKEKALITFSKDNFVYMHDVLQETALEIVRRKFIECPGSCSWMWKPDDIYEALKNDKVSEAIRSLQISLQKMEQKLIPHVFAKMKKLRFLEIFLDDSNQRLTLAEGLQFLSTEIRFLDFNCYPLKSLPENFCTKKLVVLKLRENSMEKLWGDVKYLMNLKTLDLSGSKMLKELPDLSKAINLEVLLLSWCSMLTSVHPSISSLPKLKQLDLQHCSSLENLPELPTSVETLDVSNCPALVTLSKLSTSLETLDVSNCPALVTLPELFPSLRTLYLNNCPALVTLPVLPSSLQTLELLCCKSLESLPEFPLSLETLNIDYCKSLKTVLFPSTAAEQLKENRKRVLFRNCLNLDEHSLVAIGLNAQINMMKFAHRHLSSPNHDYVENHPDRAIYMYPGSRVPKWLENKTTKDYIIIDLSSAPASPHWGFIFCFVFGKYQDYIERLEVNLIISDDDGEGKKDTVTMYIHDMKLILESNHVCVMYDQRCSSVLNRRAKSQMRFKIQLTIQLEISDGTLAALPQEVLKGFGVSPVSSSTYGNFIQQMELRDKVNVSNSLSK